jgi:hypothetical protein
MNKAIVALVLVLAVSTHPALAGKRQAADAPNTKGKDEPRLGRSTVANAGPAECKKYFPLIGSLVSVPCAR